MSLYVFDNNCDKVNEKINMIYFGDNDVYFEEIGNMYNLFDYFRDNSFDNDKILFCNFTCNKLEKLIFYISKYKNIDVVLDYNSIIVSDKKKIRGLDYAKMDR
ncbi:MAG: hypothetical protein ACI310_03740 [Bacilli bacterium]